MYDNLGGNAGVHRPPMNPQQNPFGNAFYGAGSVLIYGGLGAYGEKFLGSSSEFMQSNVDAHLKALKTLCRRKAVSSEEGDILVLTWVQQFLSKALKIIDKYVADITEGGKAYRFVLIQGIIPLLHMIITSGNSEAKLKKLANLTVSVKDISPSLYIQSWVTMGKICLVDGKLGKRYIPLFVQELEKRDCAALQNNIMLHSHNYYFIMQSM